MTGAVWLDPASCSLDTFKQQVERVTAPDMAPLAAEIRANIPIYDGAAIRDARDDPGRLQALMAEWNTVFADGPGIVAFRRAYDDADLIDRVSEVLNGIVATEESSSSGQGDHFATAGANSRLWNAHEKLCLADPALFARYNANPIISLVSRSWLGPHYQITTQVNIVRPGGAAQVCHRDYHMGFQGADDLVAYPASVHRLSPLLTLQGAIAHTDMPLRSGPTKLLPYSQRFVPGYIASLQPAFRAYFEDHFVQLPLTKGDAVFFNPAVFHAAGDNISTDIHRFANLMQIGSAYGRSIEIVDRTAMCRVLYPLLRRWRQEAKMDPRDIDLVIDAGAEGYPFPVNLDIDPPLSGMAPPSQQDLFCQALRENWNAARFTAELTTQSTRRQPG